MNSVQLPGSVVSSRDISSIVSEFKIYGRWLASEDIKKQVSAKNAGQSAPPTLTKNAEELLRTYSGNKQITGAMVDQLIENLNQLSSDSPSLHITLAAPPSGALKTQIVEWCRNNIHQSSLVDFSFNATLLGGMVLTHGSHTYDWSFKRSLLANRSKFPEVLRRV